MLIESHHPIDSWIKALKGYNFTRLCIQPSPGSWSLGQLYIHLIDDTRFYLQQVKDCAAANDHMQEEATPGAKTMFLHNAFPDAIIEGAPSHAWIPQPQSKEALMESLLQVKNQIIESEKLLSQSRCKGKTQHPGLGYFSGSEWLQFAGMHFRHHLRQKERIDDFLKKMH